MSFSIYIYKGIQDTLIKEKFLQSDTTKIYMYVGKSADGTLGFDTNNTAVMFVERFLDQRVSVLFPSLEIIDSKEKIKKSIHNLRGISFLNNSELLKQEHDKYLLYENKRKKNVLLARYNKPVEQLEIPTICDWYDSSTRRYSKEFLEYCRQHEINFIVWAFSAFGSYFFSFKTVNDQVRAISDELGIDVTIVDDISKMPYH